MLRNTSNQWPDSSVLDMQPVFDEMIGHMGRLGTDLMCGLAIGLKLEPEYFDVSYNDWFWIMRAIHYPLTDSQCPPDPEDGTGCGVHTDYGNLTIILQDDCHEGLLSVKSPVTHEWISPRLPPGALCCNIGDMLQCWSGGVYKSTPHMVSPPTSNSATRSCPPGRGRISVPFFFEPNYDSVVTPLIGKRDGKIVFREHLMNKLNHNFAPLD